MFSCKFLNVDLIIPLPSAKIIMYPTNHITHHMLHYVHYFKLQLFVYNTSDLKDRDMIIPMMILHQNLIMMLIFTTKSITANQKNVPTGAWHHQSEGSLRTFMGRTNMFQ